MRRSPFTRRNLLGVLGAILMVVLWLLAKAAFDIPDRFLPSPSAVLRAAVDIRPSIWTHAGMTLSRLVVGAALGIGAGIGLGLLLFRWSWTSLLMLPSLQSLRAIPAIATVPFFILWFGFSEWGKYLLVTSGVAFNIAVTVLQILHTIPEKYAVLFKGFNLPPQTLVVAYCVPTIADRILPTLRFAMATALGLVVVSELLGSQVGLGYLIQTSRSTFSMHAIFLAMILLGAMNVLMDRGLVLLWNRLTFWR